MNPNTHSIELMNNYIQVLEKENNAKNNQRKILYGEIQLLKRELEIMDERSRRQEQKLENQKMQVRSLENCVEGLQATVQKLYREAQERENQYEELLNTSRQFSQKIASLEQLIEVKQENQETLKAELQQLSHKINSLEDEISSSNHQSQSHSHGSEQTMSPNISELIENYEKIEMIAQEKDKQNQELRAQNQLAIQAVEKMRQQLETAKKVSSKNTHLHLQLPELQEVIMQNNQLIERITALEHEKNMLYSELTGKHWIKDLQPETRIFRNSTQKHTNMPSNPSSSSKLQNRIDTLRAQNQSLLESLRID